MSFLAWSNRLPAYLPSFSMERTNKVAPIAGPLKQKLAARHELEMGLARTLLRIVTHPLSRPPPPSEEPDLRRTQPVNFI